MRAPSDLARLGKQTLVYGLSGAALQLVGLVTLPLFARVFSPEQYGVLEIGNVTYALLTVLADAGLASASQRNYFDQPPERRDRRRSVLLTAVMTSTLIAVAIAIALVLLRDQLGGVLFNGRGHAEIVAVIGLTLPVTTAVQFTREAMRLEFRAWHYLTSATLAAVVAAAVSLVEVLVFDSGLVGLFIGTLAGNAAATAYGTLITRRQFGPPFSRAELRSMLHYGLPLIVPALAMWGLTFVDRFMLGGLSTLREVGEYAIANRIAGVLLFLVAAFGTAFSPFILSLYAEDRDAERRTRADSLTFVALALLTVSVALTLFARELISVIAPAFHSAYQSVGLLVLGTTAFGLSSITMTGIALARRTRWFAVYSVVAALVNVIANFALIPWAGQVGAGAATTIAFMLLAVLYYLKGQELYPAPFEPARVLRAFVVAVAVMSLGLVHLHPLGVALGIKALGLIGFGVLLRVTGVLRPAELTELVDLVRRRLAARDQST
jgi:O-antigen/teichoic acid export membrane protein